MGDRERGGGVKKREGEWREKEREKSKWKREGGRGLQLLMTSTMNEFY